MTHPETHQAPMRPGANPKRSTTPTHGDANDPKPTARSRRAVPWTCRRRGVAGILAGPGSQGCRVRPRAGACRGWGASNLPGPVATLEATLPRHGQVRPSGGASHRLDSVCGTEGVWPATHPPHATGRTVPRKTTQRLTLQHVRRCICLENWWSQGGSNSRPRHCERRALPAELWPHEGKRDYTGVAGCCQAVAFARGEGGSSRFSRGCGHVACG